jgi:hypothetical protein
VRQSGGALAKRKEIQRDHEDGLAVGPQNYTVAAAVQNWLESQPSACELEPPVGIEPTTYSLRVNRSAD